MKKVKRNKLIPFLLIFTMLFSSITVNAEEQSGTVGEGSVEQTLESSEPIEEPEKIIEESDEPLEEPSEPIEEPDEAIEEPDEPVEVPEEILEEPDETMDEDLFEESDEEELEQNTLEAGDNLIDFTAILKYDGSEIELLENSTDSISISYFTPMSLEIEAEFGAGTEKQIEVTLPEGMTFREDIYKNSGYVVYGTDDTLKEIITPDKQTEDNKKNTTILGVNQLNGTITLRFNGQGEMNDAEKVRFSIPVNLNSYANYNSSLWSSGIAWYYDSVQQPIIVTQSYNNLNGETLQLTKSLQEIQVQNPEEMRYQSTWNSKRNPEAALDVETIGGEGFRVQTIPNGGTYTRAVAVRKYSITFTAAEGTSFEGFNKTYSENPLNEKAGEYQYTETTAGNVTPDGMTVESGRVAFTFTVENRLLYSENLLLYPIWKFSNPIQGGDQVPIKVEDIHIHFWGRDEEHPIDSSKLPQLTYNIVDKTEEVFVNVVLEDENRYTDGYISDTTLDMGAPGYEHIQERSIGYFLVGNRGLGDSVPKKMTFTYDENNTGTYGVTQQAIPTLNSNAKVGVTAIRYKLYDDNTKSSDSEWREMTADQISALRSATGNSNITYLNLSDVGIDGDSGYYFKSIQLDVTTIPANSYLRTGQTVNRNASYAFLGRVLNDQVYSINSRAAREEKSQLKARLLIEDLDGGNTHKPVDGLLFNGSSGKSKIVMNYDGYAESGYSFYNGLKVGEGLQQVKLGIFNYDWADANAQDIKAVYLISPFGEPIQDLTLYYVKPGDERACRVQPISGKKHTTSTYTDELALDDVVNGIRYEEITELSEELKEKYPDARLYKIDFSGVTDEQEVYDKRRIANTVDPQKTASKSGNNTHLATTNRYNGIAITYNIAPNIKDTPGNYTDLTWVEFDEKGADNVKYVNGGHRANKNDDVFKLSDSTNSELKLGKLQRILYLPTEELVVSSAAKQSGETDDFYRTYVSGDDSTILGVYNDIDYKLSVSNTTSTDVNDFSVYWPIPKSGENWGTSVNPEGAFNYSMNLKNALKNVPEGYVVSYAKNAVPNNSYDRWNAYDWTVQEDTSSWSPADWSQVNFVRIVWVGTDTKQAITTGTFDDFVFDLAVDSTSTTPEQMYTRDTWAPYFRRTYTSSTSWVAGKPVSAMLTPGKITGTVWEDTNYDGKMDTEETRVKGAVVKLYDISTGVEILRTTTTTDADGNYEFYGLFDGLSESGMKDSSRIVIERPDDYIDFTKFENDMAEFNPYNQTDGDTNVINQIYADATLDRTESQIFNAGVINTVPAENPIIEKKIDGDDNNELKNIEFTFVMKENEQEIAIATVKGQGSTSFKEVVHVGLNEERTLTISEQSTNNINIKDDISVYTWILKNFKEDGIWKFTSTTMKDEQESDVVFTNTYAPIKKSIKVQKHWDDAENQDGKRPDSITVHLLADGVEVVDKELTESEKWSGEFSDVNQYTVEGTEIVYTILEDEVEGYTTKINEYNIINSHIPEKTEVSGTKIWDDNENQDGKRPESIEIKLLADGTVINTIKVSEKENWSWSFKNLPKYKDQGTEIVYTVEESAVEGYTTTYEGYNVTNVHIPETVEVEGTKIWKGDDSGSRPESITINLLADDKKIQTIKVTKADDWKWKFTDLPKYKNQGTAIVYTITEDEVSGYTSKITGNASKGFTVTNTKKSNSGNPSSGNSTNDKSSGSKSSPKTGDDTNIIIWLLIMAVAICIILFLVYKRRKK